MLLSRQTFVTCAWGTQTNQSFTVRILRVKYLREEDGDIVDGFLDPHIAQYLVTKFNDGGHN